MNRRRFVSGVAVGFVAMPFTIEAQQAIKVPRIGYLGGNRFDVSQPSLAAFQLGLRAHGWIDGQNIVVEARFAEGRADQLPVLAAELIHLKVDVIVTSSSATTWAAKDATNSIPIVMGVSADAVGEGLVASLAHPGGNITGMTFLVGPEVAGKQLELLKEVAPAASRVAVLTNSTNRSHATLTRELKVAARAVGVQLQIVDARSPDQLDGAFAAMTMGRAAALLVQTDSMFIGQRERVAALAARSRLPAIYYQREHVDAGGLISYGANLADMFRHVGTHVDKILKGARPRDIPIEQPTKFELVINMKTAKALGVTIPKSLLFRADEIVQ